MRKRILIIFLFIGVCDLALATRRSIRELTCSEIIAVAAGRETVREMHNSINAIAARELVRRVRDPNLPDASRIEALDALFDLELSRKVFMKIGWSNVINLEDTFGRRLSLRARMFSLGRLGHAEGGFLLHRDEVDQLVALLQDPINHDALFTSTPFSKNQFSRTANLLLKVFAERMAEDPGEFYEALTIYAERAERLRPRNPERIFLLELRRRVEASVSAMHRFEMNLLADPAEVDRRLGDVVGQLIEVPPISDEAEATALKINETFTLHILHRPDNVNVRFEWTKDSSFYPKSFQGIAFDLLDARGNILATAATTATPVGGHLYFWFRSTPGRRRPLSLRIRGRQPPPPPYWPAN